jgi:stearoyl-CoA desaturase (delta-9 desaturase)
MSRTARISNLLAVTIPFVAVIAAIIIFWDRGVGWHDLALFAVMYLVTGFGVTVGFHRMLTHRAFATSKPVEYLFAMLGSMSVQGPVIAWVSDHRKHHAHADEEGDPHSPHVGGGSGLRGLVHAHVGWLVSEQGLARKRKYAADLLDDPGMRRISRAFPAIVVAGLALPALAGT